MKIFLAGGENQESAYVLQGLRAPYVLMSYYYLRSSKAERIFDLLKGYRDNGTKLIMLDSGAHTFFTEYGIGELGKRKQQDRKTTLEETPEEYFNSYVSWLKKYGHLFDFVVELDIDRVPGVGIEKVLEWRKRFKEEGINNLLPVFHSSMPLALLDELCKEYDFIAVEGDRRLGEYNSYFNIAKKYKTKIHGFAMTKFDIAERMPFFSGDSTSWKTGSQFGATFIFRGNKIEGFGKEDKSQRKRVKNDLVKAGINWERLEQDDRIEVDKMNAYAWIRYSEYLEKRKKGYWEDSTDRIKESPPLNPKFEEYKGRVQEICKENPQIEEKRIQAVIRSNKLMPKNFKHGKYASILPQTCNSCYAGEKGKCPFYKEPKNEEDRPVCVVSIGIRQVFDLDNLDIRDKDSVLDAISLLARIMIERIGMQVWFEKLDGGILDKAVTSAIKTLGDLLRANVPIFQTNTQININKQIIKDINKIEDEKARAKILRAIREANNESRE